MDLYLITSLFILSTALLIGFLFTFVFTITWIKKAKQIGLVWEDMNKKNFPRNIVGSGGISVLLGFVLGVLFYIQIKTFYFKSTENLIEILALVNSILIIGSIGFLDDLFGWRKGGLSKKSRIILILFAAIPLIVINAGVSTMMGIEFGLLYPLFFIPLGVVGASVTFNFIAGYNGLETSQGILILFALTIVNLGLGNKWLALVSAIMVSSLIAFYIFNKYPSKVFPGDVLTYPVGALIAGIAILGNIEKIAVFFFIPYIIETGLKLRGGLKKESFGKVNKDGSLDLKYQKIYGLEHLSIYLMKKLNIKATEKRVVYSINLFQIMIIVLGLILFGNTIFI
ncbi:MAG: glycosyl transferase family 4 [Candidatus Nanoarchaeia archaeon]